MISAMRLTPDLLPGSVPALLLSVMGNEEPSPQFSGKWQGQRWYVAMTGVPKAAQQVCNLWYSQWNSRQRAGCPVVAWCSVRHIALPVTEGSRDLSWACSKAVTYIWSPLFPLSIGKAIMYMTIRLTVLRDIQPLLNALMIHLWSVFNVVRFVQMFTRITRLFNASQRTPVSIRVLYYHV